MVPAAARAAGGGRPFSPYRWTCSPYSPVTDGSLNFINLAAALVYTVTVPYPAIQLTLYYFDLEAEPVRPSTRASTFQVVL
jgi:hypothetical protein